MAAVGQIRCKGEGIVTILPQLFDDRLEGLENSKKLPVHERQEIMVTDNMHKRVVC